MRGVAGNLPQELTSFVGRRRELSEVKRLLVGSRLVTLVGVEAPAPGWPPLRASPRLTIGKCRDGVVDDTGFLRRATDLSPVCHQSLFWGS